MSGHQPFSNLTANFSPQRKAKIVQKTQQLQAEMNLNERHSTLSLTQLESIRNKILNSYLDTIEESFRENRSQFKLINYGTGSGKTHQLFEAMCQTIKKYPDIQTIGIYVAPLREHLSVPSQVKTKYPDIPVYTVNSLEMKTKDKYIQLYKKWIPSILKNAKLWKKVLKFHPSNKIEEYKQKLKIAKGVINRLEYIKNVGLGDEKYNESETTRAKRELNNALESFLEFFIKWAPRKIQILIENSLVYR